MKRRPLLHLLLFLGTCVTTWSCFRYFYGGSPLEAAMFAASALLILGAHEMGHYVMARWHGVDSSLPYFIPVPVGFGTLGAVIRIRGRIPTRNALVDIGAAGPLAGLAMAVPLLFVGVLLSPVGDAAVTPSTFPGPMSLFSLGRGLVDLAATRRLPELGNQLVFGDNLLSLFTQRLVHGPLPPGKDLYAHPVLVAAWFGMVVTMLNLMPIGQLDGGHLTHAWFGPRAIPLGKALAVGLGFLAFFFSVGWVMWLVIAAKVIGFRHPEVVLPDEPLSRSRKQVCALCFLCFALTLMPVPISAA